MAPALQADGMLCVDVKLSAWPAKA